MEHRRTSSGTRLGDHPSIALDLRAQTKASDPPPHLDASRSHRAGDRGDVPVVKSQLGDEPGTQRALAVVRNVDAGLATKTTLRDRRREVLALDEVIVAGGQGQLHRALELPDVERPIVLHERLNAPGRERDAPLVTALVREPVDERGEDEAEILAAVAEARQGENEALDARVQIPAKATQLD